MRSLSLLCAAVLLLAGAAHAQGVVDVTYTPAHGRFADAGDMNRDVERTEAQLTAHLESLARRLPAGTRLSVTVTEIDLAGEPYRARADQPRVLTGRADRPLISLRFSLTQADGKVEQGEARLTDLNYLDRPATSNRPLAHEKRLLDDWFRERFASLAG